ncbi:uncharacterized protein M6B38_379085 [Iris pallida]|uniref:PB1 domain-containing protein n=1 Tax=Iris pallida TaxID=29817 RepID=A0AAX6GAF8_IRIPA|nr:uncharacterized protein M6B38_379085 [Iris pallida]
MVGTTTSTTPTTSRSSSSSSSSSCVSITSFDDVSVKSNTLKFVCSYGGKILPRYPEGKLRYIGGETRVIAVDRSLTFSDLLGKMGELCGWPGAVRLRCQMPTEDMDALVSVTSDEDLANLVEEYDLASRVKIRAFLHPSISAESKGKTVSQPAAPVHHRCFHQFSPQARFSVGRPGFGNPRYYHQHQHQHRHHQQYLVHQ